MGIATVPVAVIGVSPMTFVGQEFTEDRVRRNLRLVGGTPTRARETRAIPEATALTRLVLEP